MGLHQCPSERKGEGVPVRNLRVPSHVPSHPQTAAKVRGFSPIASGFTAETDWLLEQRGFELPVPLARIRLIFAEEKGLRVDQSGQNRPSVFTGDQWFESPLLQQGVWCEPDLRGRRCIVDHRSSARDKPHGGTEGSNLAASSGESGANLTFGYESQIRE